MKKKSKYLTYLYQFFFSPKLSWNFFHKNCPAYEIRTFNLPNDAPYDLQLTHANRLTTLTSTRKKIW